MVGGTLMGFMAAVYYWFPKFFGKMNWEAPAKFSCFLIFLGFNVTFMPQFMMGGQGMPRRYYDYLPEFTIYHQISTIGAYMIGIGFLIAGIFLVYDLICGEKASDNPWQGLTLEWQTSSPPPHENFKNDPVVTHGPYDYGVEVRA